MDEQSNREKIWSKLQPSSTPDKLLYLDTFRTAAFVQEYKKKSYALLDVQEGDLILEVGCGPGDDARALAQMVGSTGSVIGVDNDPNMVAEARLRAVGTGLSVAFYLCDIQRLAIANGIFDACRAERVFQHLQDPGKALSELIRVAKPGARILVMEPDWETLAIDVPDKATTREIVNFICDRIVRNGWMGRQLPNLFRASGLTKVGIIANAIPLTDFILADRLWGLMRNVERARKAGVITASESQAWIQSLKQAGRDNQFFGAVTGISALGIKP
jgi:ubiquinone/menaquinone biosynthesis C-methylase UbiE